MCVCVVLMAISSALRWISGQSPRPLTPMFKKTEPESEKRKNQAAEAGPVLRVADPLLPPSPSSECCLRFGHQTISTWI